MDYETGVLVAFFAWLLGNINLVVTVNSTMEKNLNRIGQRFSWATLIPKEMTAADQNRPWWMSLGKFLLIALIGLPFILLSWFQVALFVGSIAYRKMKDSGAPQNVREFRWKLRNVDMTLDQLLKEMMKLTEQDPEKFEPYKADFIANLEERGLKVFRF